MERKLNAHSFLMDKGVKSMGTQINAHTIEKWMVEFANQEIKLLNLQNINDMLPSEKQDKINNGVVAVFAASESDFRKLRFHPEKNYTRIVSPECVMGCRFSEVVVTCREYDLDLNMFTAMLTLKERQPELFK